MEIAPGSFGVFLTKQSYFLRVFKSPHGHSKASLTQYWLAIMQLKLVALGYLDLRHRMGGEGQGEKRLTWVCGSAGKERGHNSH